MKLQACLLLSTVIACFAADEGGIGKVVDVVVLMRNEQAFEALEMIAVEGIDSMKAGSPKRLYKKIADDIIAILKATVARHTTIATPEQLDEMSRQLAEDVRALNPGFQRKVAMSEEIFKIASNTTLLTKEPDTSVKDSQLSPSTFANAVKRTGSGAANSLYTIAAFSRCCFDKLKALKKAKESDDDAYTKIGEQCLAKFQLSYTQVTDFLKSEVLESFGSRENVARIVKELAFVMKVIQDPESYGRDKKFVEIITRNKSTAAARVFILEITKCYFHMTDREIEERTDPIRGLLLRVLKMAFADEEEPDEERMAAARDQLVAALNKAMPTNMFESIGTDKIIEADSRKNFSECLVPRSTMEKIENISFRFTGDSSDEIVLLQEIKKHSTFLHSAAVLLIEHVHSLHRRHGMNEQARQFINQVLTKLPELSETDGTTDAGRAAQARITEELRNSFINLSTDTKKIFADHFPFRTTALLGGLF